MTEKDIRDQIKKERKIINTTANRTLAVTESALLICMILNLIAGRHSYDLLLIFWISLFAENIQLYKAQKKKGDFIMIIILIAGIVGMTIVYTGSLLDG